MKRKKGRLLHHVMVVLLAVLLIGGGNGEGPAVVKAAGTAAVTIKITIEGYDGNDPAVLGTVTLKNLLTDEEWTNVAMSGNVIICEAQGCSPGTYACMIDGKIYGYQLAGITADSDMTCNYTFYTVHFMNGAEVYETEYVSKKEFLNSDNPVGNTATAPAVPPEKEGYDFAGWVTAEGGSDAFDFNSPITGVTTIYASWTEKVEAPVITDYPEIIGCNSTTNKSVSVTATGTDLSYQWQINRNDGSGFVDIPGETSASITVSRPETEQDGHLYKCVVSNAAGSAETGGIELVVYNRRGEKAKDKIAEALAGMTVSNDTSQDDIQNMVDTALANAGITRVITEVKNFNNTPATLDAAGKVSGYISVKCSGNIWEVSINKTIPMIHVCSLQSVPRQEPDCTASGKESYYHCEDCGKSYEDAGGTSLIADLGAWGNIAALGHTEDGGTVTKQPSDTEEGTRTYCCQRCGIELRIEAIPPTGGGQPDGEQGNIDKDVQTDGKAPDTQLSAPAAELADIILTPEEKQQVQSGADIKIILDVKDATGSVSNEDKALIEAALDDLTAADGSGTESKFTVGQHLDIGLFKVVGENRSAISQITQKITITIAVPEGLKSTDGGKARTFAVIRVHNGQVELLEDLDGNDDTITIATDRFSTYTIVYREGKDSGSGDGDDGNGGSGDDGNGGNTGTPGDGGNSGDTGNTGDSGTGGNTGAPGDGGNSGDTGNTGDSGNGGNTGAPGDGGNSGDTGNTGDSGTGGNTGAPGDGGNSGNTGNTGDSGNGGNTGAPGDSGNVNSGNNTPVTTQGKDSEPETGDTKGVELYAALAMIAGLAYLFLYFTDRKREMTEQAERKTVSK